MSNNITKTTDIGIAVVIHNNQYLVGIRGKDIPLAGKAEFPGGKCLPDESIKECAIRECFEETGLKVTAIRLLYETEHDYPHGLLALSFWRCVPVDNNVIQTSHNGYRWVDKAQLDEYEFPEANQNLINLLMKQ